MSDLELLLFEALTATTDPVPPTPAEVFTTAQYLGWVPAEPYLRPAVPAEGRA